MNGAVKNTGYMDVQKPMEPMKTMKPMKYNVSVFTNLIVTKKEMYLSKRDFYAEANDDLNMRYYEAKANACGDLLYTISLMF